MKTRLQANQMKQQQQQKKKKNKNKKKVKPIPNTVSKVSNYIIENSEKTKTKPSEIIISLDKLLF